MYLCKFVSKLLTKEESLTGYSRYMIVSQDRSIEYADSPILEVYDRIRIEKIDLEIEK